LNKYIAYSLVGLFLFSNYKRRQSEVKVFYVKKLPRNYNGLIIPAVGVFIKESEKDNKELLNHELIHWEQYRREGLLMLPKYIIENLRNGYDSNKYEVEARGLESDFCKYNYTECVRSGISNTAYNPNFRK
tara:strand:+ start:442 stop:834 length:393 start_codon:yes stop_codon:yes gene_type:complete